MRKVFDIPKIAKITRTIVLESQSAICLGGGSFASIGPALKKWRAALAEQHELAGVELPGELAGEREALAAARGEIEAEVQEQREAVQQLEAEAEQRIARIDELEQQHAAAMEAAAQQERRNAELTAALAAAQAATAAEVTKVEAVFSERVHGLEARLADAQHTIERLTERSS